MDIRSFEKSSDRDSLKRTNVEEKKNLDLDPAPETKDSPRPKSLHELRQEAVIK